MVVVALRVHYSREAMPRNNQGVAIDPTEWGTLGVRSFCDGPCNPE
jgi:hypothetical protein